MGQQLGAAARPARAEPGLWLIVERVVVAARRLWPLRRQRCKVGVVVVAAVAAVGRPAAADKRLSRELVVLAERGWWGCDEWGKAGRLARLLSTRAPWRRVHSFGASFLFLRAAKARHSVEQRVEGRARRETEEGAAGRAKGRRLASTQGGFSFAPGKAGPRQLYKRAQGERQGGRGWRRERQGESERDKGGNDRAGVKQGSRLVTCRSRRCLRSSSGLQ